jgi:hypothetical protein
MTSTQIKPYCQTCKICKTPDQFNLTPNNTYRYTCKVCVNDIEREKSRVLYEETKHKLEEQQQHQKHLSEKEYIVFHCPHEDCNMLSIVYNIEIHCGIFRCGYNKLTNQQIPQHASKTECDILRNDKNIIGCTQPYRLVGNLPEKCDYI